MYNFEELTTAVFWQHNEDDVTLGAI